MLIARRALIRLSVYVRLAIAACVLGSAPGAFAQANIPLTVSGNQATGVIQLPGGIGADLSITFEDVVGLNPAALDVSAALVNPLDLILRARLGGGGQILPPIAFPVLIRIDPSPSSALTFSGTVNVSLHTHNLNLLPILPLGLHTAYRRGLVPRHDPVRGDRQLPRGRNRRGVLGVHHRARPAAHQHRDPGEVRRRAGAAEPAREGPFPDPCSSTSRRASPRPGPRTRPGGPWPPSGRSRGSPTWSVPTAGRSPTSGGRTTTG